MNTNLLGKRVLFKYQNDNGVETSRIEGTLVALHYVVVPESANKSGWVGLIQTNLDGITQPFNMSHGKFYVLD